MNLIRSFVESPVKVAVGALLISLFGTVALLRMPMQLIPEVETPMLTIETRWPGASPQEVEQEIVHEQEAQLKSVEGVIKMSSESSDSMGRILLEFSVGTDMQKSLLDVNSRLNQVPEYPEDADQPVISTSNVDDRPIARYMLSHRRVSDETLAGLQAKHASNAELVAELERVRETKSDGLAMLRLREAARQFPEAEEAFPKDAIEIVTLKRFVEDEIESRFERVDGVSQAEVQGGLEDELQVVVDPEQLAARGLTIDDVARVLRGQNQDTSAGDYNEGKRRYVVRTLGQFRSPEQVETQLLTVQLGAPVYVRDVAEVRLGHKKPDSVTRRFGASTIGVNVLRETGANVLDVMDRLRETMRELNEGLLADKGLQLVQTYDETEYIHAAVGLVNENIFIGSALTMITLMVFLHMGVRTVLAAPLILGTSIAAAYISPWIFVIALVIIVGAGFWWARGALVVCLMIPISVIGTFMIMQLMGRSLNVISLAGLAFAIGMLVDNAVVVLENIYRRHDELGEDPFTAAVRGGNEVWGALVSSSLTTVAVFLPIVFIQQESGQLFRDIALAIATSTLISLFVGMAVIPTAAARLIGNRKEDLERTAARQPKRRWFHKAADWCVEAVVGVNAFIQATVFRRVMTCVAILGLACFFTWALWPKVEYLPTGNRNFVFGTLVPPPGYSVDELMLMGAQIEADLKPYWDVDPGTPEAEALDYPVIDDFFFAARGKRVFMGLRAHDQQRAGELVPLIQKVGKRLPGTFVVAKQSSLFERGASAGRTIEIEIAGPELETLIGLGGRILGQVKQKFPAGTQVRPVPSLDLSSPELHIEPKLVQSAEMGVTSTSLGYAANAFVDGAYAGDYFLEGDKIDLTIIGKSNLADSSQAIRSLPVATPIGQLVPLEALADVTLSSGPEQVNHRERVRAIMIEVSPPPELPLQDAMEQLENEIVGPIRDAEEFPSGYRITLAGTADKLRDAWGALQFNLLLALLITYLLMAALFESWIYPLVLILSIPTGAVGGIVGLQLLNLFVFQSLDVLTMLGFVILIGTVVNNPILIVHQALTLMKESGMPLKEATLDAVRTRIRPIFMTTVTTVIGLAPLVVFPGAGSELYRGIGSVLLGGLAVSTIVTLVLVPAMFTLAAELRGLALGLAAAAGIGHVPVAEPPAPPPPPEPEPEEELQKRPAPRERLVAETTAGD